MARTRTIATPPGERNIEEPFTLEEETERTLEETKWDANGIDRSITENLPGLEEILKALFLDAASGSAIEALKSRWDAAKEIETK